MSTILRDRIVRRFKEATNVVPFKPAGPTIAIGGKKYALSDYWSETDVEEVEGGARLIMGPKRFSFLWAFDTDKKYVAMWRVSDGEGKAGGAASHHTKDIVALERKKQLNRVTNEEFRTIDRFMAARGKETLALLKKTIEENEDDWDRESRRLVQEFFNDKVLPKILAKFREIDQGVSPLGFKPRDFGRPPLEQAKVFVAGQIMQKLFQLSDIDDFVRTKGVDPDNPPGGSIQALDWARHDVMEAFYDERFPFIGDVD